jgi:hypothetical protein
VPDSISLPAIAHPIDGDDVAAELSAKRERLAEAEIEMDEIARAGIDLYREIDKLVNAFAQKHGCEGQAEGVLLEIDDLVGGLILDAGSDALRLKYSLEDEIAALEDAS